MLLGNPYAAVAEENRNFLHWHSFFQKLHSERVPEPVRMATLDFRGSEHVTELAAPEITGRIHPKRFGTCKEILPVSQLYCTDGFITTGGRGTYTCVPLFCVYK